MAHTFVKDLKVGQTVNQYFLVKKKELRKTRNDEEFINVILTDASGDITGKIWKEKIGLKDHFRQGDFVALRAVVGRYGDNLQLVIDEVENTAELERKGELDNFDLTVLLPRSSQDVDRLYQELMQIVETEIGINSLRDLTKRILVKYKKAFKEYPAARLYHHSHLGGLIEHTYFVARAVTALADGYGVNRSLAISGAILHDIGKLREIQYPAISLHTYEGELLGHLLLGRDIIREESIHIDWEDERLLSQVEHIIVSHHGELEFGSPVIPKTREALIVHFCDNLDAHMNMFTEHLKMAGEEEFTEWHPVLRRTLCRSDFGGLGSEEERKGRSITESEAQQVLRWDS